MKKNEKKYSRKIETPFLSKFILQSYKPRKTLSLTLHKIFSSVYKNLSKNKIFIPEEHMEQFQHVVPFFQESCFFFFFFSRIGKEISRDPEGNFFFLVFEIWCSRISISYATLECKRRREMNLEKSQFQRATFDCHSSSFSLLPIYGCCPCNCWMALLREATETRQSRVCS